MTVEKSANIIIRVTPDEKQSIDAEAEKIGLSTSAFLLLLARQYSDGIRFEKKNAKNATVK